MSCVWEGIIDALDLDIKPLELLQKIQKENTKTDDIYWNNEKLTEKQLEENFAHIKNLSYKEDIPNGYLCSACDPLLFLISEIFEVSIQHDYMGHQIVYHNKNAGSKKICFGSDSDHFYVDKRKTKAYKKLIRKHRK